MKIRYTQWRSSEKTLKNGKIDVCLANDVAKPPLKPCEAERSGKGEVDALAIATCDFYFGVVIWQATWKRRS
jgi:hypothetical protein